MAQQKFVVRNAESTPLHVIIDPPCAAYILAPGESLQLILHHRAGSSDAPFRMRLENESVCLDIDPNCGIRVTTNTQDQTIWNRT